MRVYKNVVKVEVKNIQNNKCLVSLKKLRIISLFFICILSFGVMGFSLSTTGLSKEVKYITSSWAPNISGLGKLKYVDNSKIESDIEAFLTAESMSMPFENNYATEVEDGVFLVNGLGGIVVRCCLAGKVIKIENDNIKKSVYVSHGKGLVSVYENLDNIGVEVGDAVEKNTAIGVSESSLVQFKMLYKNKVLAGLSIKNGEIVFL